MFVGGLDGDFGFLQGRAWCLLADWTVVLDVRKAALDVGRQTRQWFGFLDDRIWCWLRGCFWWWFGISAGALGVGWWTILHAGPP